MKIPIPFSRRNDGGQAPPMAYSGPSRNDRLPPTQRIMGGHCVAFSSHSAAILITFLTLANGIVDFVNGLQWFAAGGSLARGQDIFETIAGAIIDGTSVVSVIVLYSRLKVIPGGRWFNSRGRVSWCWDGVCCIPWFRLPH
jgi:hypothetical protein